MTGDDFDVWFDDYCAAYPGTLDFVRKADPSGLATQKHWLAILESVSLADAMEVTRRMLAGLMPEVDADNKGFNKAATPRHVKKLCASMRPITPEYQQAGTFSGRYRSPAWSAGAVYQQIVDCRAVSGDVHALIAQLMPVDREDEPRFRCRTCRDVGMVFCWHPYTMHLAATNSLEPPRGLYRCAVRCNCQAGDRFESQSRGSWDKSAGRYRRDKPIIFNDAQWRPCYGFGPDDIADLERFMEDYRPPNYEKSFDSYNQSSAF